MWRPIVELLNFHVFVPRFFLSSTTDLNNFMPAPTRSGVCPNQHQLCIDVSTTLTTNRSTVLQLLRSRSTFGGHLSHVKKTVTTQTPSLRLSRFRRPRHICSTDGTTRQRPAAASTNSLTYSTCHLSQLTVSGPSSVGGSFV